MIPENSAHTGEGATASASAVQKWNGTTAALTRNPVRISTSDTTMTASGRLPERAAPRAAKVSAPVRP